MEDQEKKICNHCGKPIPIIAKVCSECGRYQNWFSNIASNHSIIAVLIIPLVLVGISIVQLNQTSSDRRDSRDALVYADSAKVYAESIRDYANSAHDSAMLALATAKEVEISANEMFNLVEALKDEQDSFYIEFKEIILLSIRNSLLYATTKISWPGIGEKQMKLYGEGTKQLVTILIPDKRERDAWWNETFKMTGVPF